MTPRKAGSKPRRRRSLLRRTLVSLAWIVGSLVIGGAVAWGLRDWWLAPILLARLQTYLEREHGLVLSVDGVGGDWVDNLLVTGVTLAPIRPRGGFERLKVAVLIVDFDLGRWWSDEKDWLERIDFNGVDLRIDARTRAGEVAAPSGPGEFVWPAAVPEIAINQLEFELLLDGGRTLRIRDGGLRVSPTGAGDDFALDLGSLELAGAWPGRVRRVRARAQGSYESGRIELGPLALEGDLEARVHSGQVDLSQIASGRAAFDLEGELFGGRLRAGATLSGGDLEARFEAEDVQLEPILRLTGAEPFEGAVSASGEAVLAGGSLWCAARGSARDLCIDRVAVDELAFDAILSPGRIEIASLDLRQGVNLAYGRNLLVPLDRDTPLDTLRASRGSLELEIDDVTALAGTSEFVPAHHVTLAGELDEDGAQIASGSFRTARGALYVRRGRVRWSAPGQDFLEHTSFDIDLAVSFADLAEVGPILGTSTWGGSVDGTLNLSGTLLRPVGELDLAGHDVVVHGYELGSLLMLARVDGARLDVRQLATRGALGELDLAGQFDLEQQSLIESRWRVASSRLADLVPRWVQGGALSLEASISGPWREPTAQFELDARDLLIVGAPAVPSASIAGELSPGLVKVASLRAEVEGVELSAAGQVEHAQWQLPLVVHLDRASFRRGAVEVGLAAPCIAHVEPDGIDLPAVELSGTGGRLRGWLRSNSADLVAQIASDDFDSMTLLRPFLPEGVEIGRARAELDLERHAGLWAAEGTLDVDEVWFSPDLPPVSFDVRATARDGRAAIDALNVITPGVLSLTLSGEVPYDPVDPFRWEPGELRLDARADLQELRAFPWIEWNAKGSIDGALEVRTTLEGAWPDLCGTVTGEGHGLMWEPRPRPGLPFELPLDPAELTLRLVLDGGIALERFELHGGERLAVTLEGQVFGPDDLRAILEKRGSAWRDAAVDLRGKWRVENLSFLSQVLPGIRRAAGRSDGEVSLSGSWGSPQGQGSLRVEQGELRFATGLPAFEGIEGRATFEADRLRIAHWKSELGAGPFELDGAIDFSGEEPNLDLYLRGSELLLVQQRDLRIRADADLQWSGPISASQLRGRLDTRDSRWTRDVDWFRAGSQRGVASESGGPLFSIQSGPFANLRFDIAVSSREPLMIRTNVAKGGVRADLQLSGTGRDPELSGALFVDPTRVFLPASTLELQAGSLRIDRRDPLDPRLDLMLTTRVRGYDVTVRVEGTYRDPEVSLTSSPPLPSEDILLLILTGRPPGQTLTGDTGLEAAETVIVYLGKDLFSRMFAGDDGEFSVLERVEWQTGTDVTQAGGSTAQVSIRVVGKPEGEGHAIYLRGEKDVYERFNYGMRFVLRLR